MEDFKVSIKPEQSDPSDHARALSLHPGWCDHGFRSFAGPHALPLRAEFLSPAVHAGGIETGGIARFGRTRLPDGRGSLDRDRQTLTCTPRVALRLFRRCVDAATNTDLFIIDSELVESTMPILGLDTLGLEDADRKYLAALVAVYKGGPTGPRSIASSAGLDLATVEHVVEPALLTAGLIARTPRGRRVTRSGYEHIKTFTPTPEIVNWRKVEDLDAALTTNNDGNEE